MKEKFHDMRNLNALQQDLQTEYYDIINKIMKLEAIDESKRTKHQRMDLEIAHKRISKLTTQINNISTNIDH